MLPLTYLKIGAGVAIVALVGYLGYDYASVKSEVKHQREKINELTLYISKQKSDYELLQKEYVKYSEEVFNSRKEMEEFYEQVCTGNISSDEFENSVKNANTEEERQKFIDAENERIRKLIEDSNK
jgi:hypothetical protein